MAYPAYTRYLMRTDRAQAEADMREHVTLAERFHPINDTYAGFTLPGGVASISSPRDASAIRYTIGLSNCAAA